MSRQAAPKSRGEKGGSRGGAGSNQQGGVPVVTSDVIPGRLSNEVWKNVVAEEEDCEFVGILLEEILDATMDECYKKYISKQVLPYTVYHAKDEIMQIIEWSFLSRDVGEDMSKGTGWLEEAEPEPGVIDSWAQGSVPVVMEEIKVQRSPTPIPEEITKKSEISEDEEIVLDNITPEINVEPEIKEPKELTEVEKQIEIIKNQGKRKVKYKKHTGRLKSPNFGELGKTLLQSESEIFEQEFSKMKTKSDMNKDSAHLSPSQKSLLKLQAGRPPGNKEVTFDERGNVVGVMKLDVRSLPSHKVKVQYDIIDPEAEEAAQRLAMMRTGKLRQPMKRFGKGKLNKNTQQLAPLRDEKQRTAASQRPTPPPPLTSSTNPHTADMDKKKPQIPSYIRRQYKTKARVEPLPLPLIDTIDASPGVKITEGEVTKSGNVRLTPKPSAPKPTPLSRDRENSMLAAIGVSPRQGGRTLRVLGSSNSSMSHVKLDGRNLLRPVLSPSDITMRASPQVQSPFSVQQVVPPVISPTVSTN